MDLKEAIRILKPETKLTALMEYKGQQAQYNAFIEACKLAVCIMELGIPEKPEEKMGKNNSIYYFCPECGNPVEAHMNFCPECSKALEV